MDHYAIYDKIYNDEKVELEVLTLNEHNPNDILLLKNLIEYEIINDDTLINDTMTISQWILEAGYRNRGLMHTFIDSSFINWRRLNDDQLLFILSLMIVNPYPYQAQLEHGSRFYKGGETAKIFEYGLTIEELVAMNERLCLSIDLNKDHIQAHINGRPDRRLLRRRLNMEN